MSNTNDLFEELMNFSANKTEAKDTKLKPSEKLISDIVGYGFDISQLGAVLKTKGNQLIVSCAGSGKTTSIIFKVIYDLKSGRSTVLKQVNGNNVRVPDTIWVATFLKSGAEELKNSYRSWCRKLHCADMSQVIQFSTLHAEFMRALNILGMKTDIISEADNKRLLKKILKNYQVRSSKGGQLNDDELTSLIGALTRTRNRLDEKRYISDIYEDLNLIAPIIDGILRDWKTERMILDKVDFEDLQEVLYDYCYNKQDESIINFLSERFSYIYLDEFQDTSQIQYAILKAYCCQAKQVVAIGDDDQTIYSWRGSDNNIITKNFVEDFNPVKNDLSVNFRCPNNILKAIKPSIKKNTQRFDKVLRSSKNGGKVRVGSYSGYRQMAITLGDLVYEDVKNGKKVAILCRVNSDGLLPAMFFDRMNNFSFSVSGANMTLDSYIGRLALSIVRLFTDKYSPDVKRALSLLTWDSYGLSTLMDICRNNNQSIWTISEDDLKYSCYELSERLLSWRKFKETGDINALKLVLQEYRYSVFTNDTQFNDVMKSVLISIESLLDYYNFDSVDEFLYELEDMNDRLKAREKKVNCQVRIATVHEFKGKECDSVYIWNDSEDVFPHKRACDSLDDLEEERRIHYIACTRAKDVSTIMYITNKKGAFIDEMDLSDAEILKKETSGILKKVISDNMECKEGLEKFEKEVAVATGELNEDGTYAIDD